MPRADLDKVYAEIEQRRLKAERALERATKDAAAAQSALHAVEARQAAERVVAATSVADAGQLTEFDRELTVAREASATVNQRVFCYANSWSHWRANDWCGAPARKPST